MNLQAKFEIEGLRDQMNPKIGAIDHILIKYQYGIWVVVKIMVPFWLLTIMRQLVFRGPKKGP